MKVELWIRADDKSFIANLDNWQEFNAYQTINTAPNRNLMMPMLTPVVIQNANNCKNSLE